MNPAETGFFYLQSRYYDPETGRFINADVYISTGQQILGFNMYVYCLNSPVNYVDSDGTDSDALCWWSGTMWWLPLLDGILPVGDFAYLIGFVAIGLTSLATINELVSTTPVISVDQAIENIASQGNQVVAVEQSKTSSVGVSSTSGVTLAKKPVNLPSWGKLTVDMRHIGSGHMPGGFRNNKGNKTVFWGMTAEQVYRAIEEAYKNSKRLQTQGERILLQGYSKTYDLLIEIWLNVKSRTIETAYPKLWR